MKRIPVLAAVCLAFAVVPPPDPYGGGREVTFDASDGVTIHGDLWLTDGPKSDPILLLFHQGGGDARSEYGPLVGRLNDAGFHALAIDQRVGGTSLGGVNRTAAAIDRDLPYCEAYPDLLAALRWVEEQGFTGPKVAWGSSYSGALALRLAAEQADRLAAVIAFSPATAVPAGCGGAPAAGDVRIPALVLRPATEMKLDRVRDQLEAFGAAGIRTHVADPGVHGSSMLNPARVEGPVEPTWKVVLEFLLKVADTKSPAAGKGDERQGRP